MKKKKNDSTYKGENKKMKSNGYQRVTRNNEMSDPRGHAPKQVHPLNAYNFFFKYVRVKILHSHNIDVNGTVSSEMAPLPPPQEYFNTVDPHLKDKVDKKSRNHRKTHGKFGFVRLSKEIAAQWRALPFEEKEVFRKLAKNDMKRYLDEKAMSGGVQNFENNAKCHFKAPSFMEESKHYDGVWGWWMPPNYGYIPTATTHLNTKNGSLLSELLSSTTPQHQFKSKNLKSTTTVKNSVACSIKKDPMESSGQDNCSFGPQYFGEIPKESRNPYKEKELDCPNLTNHTPSNLKSTSHILSSLLEKSNTLSILTKKNLAVEMSDNGNYDGKIKVCEPTPIESVLDGTEFSSWELQFIKACF